MTHQIIEVPDISVVKTINDENQLLSLRDQKIVKDGALQNVGLGSGVMYSGDMYVLEENAVPIVRMVTTLNDPYFFIEKMSDIIVDWGDGVVEVNVFNHSYTDEKGEHRIKFYGARDTLTYLGCQVNQLTELDVSQNVALTYLCCDHNQLTTLDVSQNFALTEFYCSANQLTTLDISHNSALISFYCIANRLTSLVLNQNSALIKLECFANQLTTLDVSQCVSLTNISCSSNQLTSLDVKQNVRLEFLDCSDNQLTFLNISQNTKLKDLRCKNNQLKTLDISLNTILGSLQCEHNPFINDTEELLRMANSLVDRTGMDKGNIHIDSTVMGTIQEICNAKNWLVQGIQ